MTYKLAALLFIIIKKISGGEIDPNIELIEMQVCFFYFLAS